ncbi:calphotin-like [Portunus trituberculatus]|uniref:calphotin-like n=1 Tax=Portunus trituberculatus TaxID=210409 RepID=UPI001E1D00AA|nr:calphotin-like [Portunus trituberculatus]
MECMGMLSDKKFQTIAVKGIQGCNAGKAEKDMEPASSAYSSWRASRPLHSPYGPGSPWKECQICTCRVDTDDAVLEVGKHLMIELFHVLLRRGDSSHIPTAHLLETPDRDTTSPAPGMVWVHPSDHSTYTTCPTCRLAETQVPVSQHLQQEPDLKKPARTASVAGAATPLAGVPLPTTVGTAAAAAVPPAKAPLPTTAKTASAQGTLGPPVGDPLPATMGITPARTAAPAAEGTVGLPTGTLLPTTVGPVTRSTAGPLTGTLLPTPAGTSSCYYCSCCGREWDFCYAVLAVTGSGAFTGGPMVPPVDAVPAVARSRGPARAPAVPAVASIAVVIPVVVGSGTPARSPAVPTVAVVVPVVVGNKSPAGGLVPTVAVLAVAGNRPPAVPTIAAVISAVVESETPAGAFLLATTGTVVALLSVPVGTLAVTVGGRAGPPNRKHTRAFVKRLAPHPSKNSSSSRRHSRALAGAMLPTPERRAPVGGTSGPLAGIPLLATAGGTTSPPAGAHLLATAGTATAGGGAVDPPGRSPAPCHSRNSNSSKRHSMAAC